MKRRDLIRTIEAQGAIFIRHGGKHDWYQNPETKVCQPVPRHNEIKAGFTHQKICGNGALLVKVPINV